LKHHHKPYVNVNLFQDYIRTVFLHHLVITRLMQDIRQEDAILLMDNYSSHFTSLLSLFTSSRLPACELLLSHRILPKSLKFSISPCLDSSRDAESPRDKKKKKSPTPPRFLYLVFLSETAFCQHRIRRI
jgi:hypothetical protein